jgi:hypothetical protein
VCPDDYIKIYIVCDVYIVVIQTRGSWVPSPSTDDCEGEWVLSTDELIVHDNLRCFLSYNFVILMIIDE